MKPISLYKDSSAMLYTIRDPQRRKGGGGEEGSDRYLGFPTTLRKNNQSEMMGLPKGTSEENAAVHCLHCLDGLGR